MRTGVKLITMKGFIVALLILGCAFSGCEKDIITNFSGRYSGIFIYNNPADSQALPPSGPASITFDKNTYTSTGNPDRIPAGGSGTFEVINSQDVKFEDSNRWTADFDWGLILNGEYRYQAKGDSLLLAKYIGGLKVFEYRLEWIQ